MTQHPRSKGASLRTLLLGSLLAAGIVLCPATVLAEESLSQDADPQQLETTEGQLPAVNVLSSTDAIPSTPGDTSTDAEGSAQDVDNPAPEETSSDLTQDGNVPDTNTNEAASVVDDAGSDSEDGAVLEAASDEDAGNATIQDPFESGSTFVIEHGAGGAQVIDAAGGKTANCTNVQTYAYNKSDAQKWMFVKTAKTSADGNFYYYIASVKDKSQVIDVAGAKAAIGANVQLYKYNGSDAQLWRIEFVDQALGKVNLISKLSEQLSYNLALDIAGAKNANGANMQLYRSNGSVAQSFYLLDPAPKVEATEIDVRNTLVNGVYTISAASKTSMVADVAGGSTANGGNVQLYTGNKSNAQRMILTSDASGFYTIAVLGSAKVFDVAGASIIPGTNVQQYTNNGSAAQKWAIRRNADGTYTFVNKGTGLVLDIASALKNGTNVRGYIDTYKWTSKTDNPAVRSYQTFSITETTPLIAEGYYNIKSLKSQGQVIDISGGKATSGDYVQLYKGNGSMAQKFQVVSAGDGIYRIRTAASGGWLTGKAAGSTSMRVAQQGAGNSESDYDKWKVLWDSAGYWALQNVKTGQVLDLVGGSVANGTGVQTYRSNGTDAQHFIFAPIDLVSNGVYNVNSFYGTTSLKVESGFTGPGANVQAYTTNKNDDSQKFSFTKVGDALLITGYSSGYALSVSDVATPKANVTLKRATKGDYQLWVPLIADGGYLKFRNVASGMTFEAQGNTSGSNVVQHTTAVNGERWKLAAAPNASSPKAPNAGSSIRVLLIGNSFTKRNSLYSMIQSALGDAEVVERASNGKDLVYLATGAETYAKNTNRFFLNEGADWDFVVFQDLSTRPIDDPNGYLASAMNLASAIRSAGAVPIIYGTWAFAGTGKESEARGAGTLYRGISLTEMNEQLQSSFSAASDQTDAAIANAGSIFADLGWANSLFEDDVKHPSVAGSKKIAQVIADTILSLLQPVA